MKKMLMAATAAGAAIAGIILYFGRKNPERGKIKRAAKDAYNTLSEGIERAERPGQRAMG